MGTLTVVVSGLLGFGLLVPGLLGPGRSMLKMTVIHVTILAKRMKLFAEIALCTLGKKMKVCGTMWYSTGQSSKTVICVLKAVITKETNVCGITRY